MPQAIPIDFKQLIFNAQTFIDKITEFTSHDKLILVDPKELKTKPQSRKKSSLFDDPQKSLCFQQQPKKLDQPVFIISSSRSATELGIDPLSLLNPNNLEYLCGGIVHQTATPFAYNYGGHQYGSYTLLGDGRTITLGETITTKSTLQLRGVGPTCYARKLDGKMTLSTCIYDFMISEMLNKLSIPTAKCLTVVGSNTACYRGTEDEIYSTGVVTRFAPSWITFGMFEFLHYRG